jgi:chromate transport protein ChrA
MTTSNAESSERFHDKNSVQKGIGLWPLTGYFLKLGTVGFGGPVALVGFMHRDLVEQRRWITEDTYKLSLALAQIMPGPLAAQVAIAIGYFEGGISGATLVGLAFVLPSFLMVVAISLAYVAYGGLWWMQALFYAIGATVIAIIAIAAYKLARSTNKRDPLLWGIFVCAHRGNRVGTGRACRVLHACRTGGSTGSGVARLETRSSHGTAWCGLRLGDLATRGLAPPSRDGSRFRRCTGPDSAVFYQSRRFRIR